MKKLILIAILCLVITPLAHAEGTEARTTSDGVYDNAMFQSFINSHGAEHHHTLPKVKRFTRGAGLETPLLVTKKVDLVNETRYNLDNKAGETYLMVKLKPEKPILNCVWDFFFNKDK